MASPVDSILERSHRVKIRGLSLRFRGAPRTRRATTYSDGSLHARTNSTMNSFELEGFLINKVSQERDMNSENSD